MQGRSTASSAEPNVRFWSILLKKSQVEARRKSAQSRRHLKSTIDGLAIPFRRIHVASTPRNEVLRVPA
jgi:hypothetical protein